MFSLRDFFHLPELDGWLERLANGEPGLAVVAGLDAHPPASAASQLLEAAATPGMLPSGRSAFISLLIDQALVQRPEADCLVVTRAPQAVRIARQFRRRMRVLPVEPPFTYEDRIAEANRKHPDLLVLDRLVPENLAPALEAARQGLFVLAPLDTVFHGPEVARHLISLGAPGERLAHLRWVISVQRLAALCANCKRPVRFTAEQLERLRSLPWLNSGRPGWEELAAAFSAAEPPQLFQPGSCQVCGGSGRQGEVTLFDVLYNPRRADGAEIMPLQDSGPLQDGGQFRFSDLPLEVYVGKLMLLGQLALDDFLDFETWQFRRLGHSLLRSEAQLAETLAEHERKLIELEAANRVLEQRTRSLVSLYEIGQALISSADLKDLAGRVCRFTQDLCGADRVILYYLHSEREAETLASVGWEPGRLPRRCDPSEVFGLGGARTHETSHAPVVYNRWPPGVPPRHPDVEGAELRAGLYLPLVAQDKRVGFMLAHTTRQPSFSPKEISLMQTMAQQAALGVQRARLVDDLRGKIDQLQAAQAELAKKERLERELELAREVQQSMLPRRFPHIPRFRFAARNQPARQVGGDFYDVIPLDEQRFGLVIADVADKGFPAALYMALTRSLLRAEAPRQISPRAVLSRLNQLLLELGDGRSFVAVFYGVVERASRRMTYSRAGQDPPLLLRQGRIQSLKGDGTPLGILQEDFRLSEEQVRLQAGDRLALYTDGLTDVAAPDGKLFSLERLSGLLEASAGQTLEGMCEAIFAELQTFQGGAEQYDDMSLMLMEVED